MTHVDSQACQGVNFEAGASFLDPSPSEYGDFETRLTVHSVTAASSSWQMVSGLFLNIQTNSLSADGNSLRLLAAKGLQLPIICTYVQLFESIFCSCL